MLVASSIKLIRQCLMFLCLIQAMLSLTPFFTSCLPIPWWCHSGFHIWAVKWWCISHLCFLNKYFLFLLFVLKFGKVLPGSFSSLLTKLFAKLFYVCLVSCLGSKCLDLSGDISLTHIPSDGSLGLSEFTVWLTSSSTWRELKMGLLFYPLLFSVYNPVSQRIHPVLTPHL